MSRSASSAGCCGKSSASTASRSRSELGDRARGRRYPAESALPGGIRPCRIRSGGPLGSAASVPPSKVGREASERAARDIPDWCARATSGGLPSRHVLRCPLLPRGRTGRLAPVRGPLHADAGAPGAAGCRRGSLVRARPPGPPGLLAGARARGGARAGRRRDERLAPARRGGLAGPGRCDQRRGTGRLARPPAGRAAGPRADRGRRAARPPDGRAGGPLAQGRQGPGVLCERDDRPLRRSRGRPGRDPRGGPMTVPTLAALLAEQARLLEETAAVPTGQGTDYYLDDVLFASLAGSVAEFHLRDEVGAVALRTPDVTSSARGTGWVRFAPRRLDGHARDRALAWLESAWRRADAELSGIAAADGGGGGAAT